ncbi:hypothetical protein AAVH_27937, partial [Aphelenchoides avenae]
MNQKRIRAEIEKSHPAPPHSGRDAAYLQRIHQMCLEHPDYDKQSPQMQHLFDTYPLYRKGDAVVFALRLRQAAFHLATVMDKENLNAEQAADEAAQALDDELRAQLRESGETAATLARIYKPEFESAK